MFSIFSFSAPEHPSFGNHYSGLTKKCKEMPQKLQISVYLTAERRGGYHPPTILLCKMESSTGDKLYFPSKNPKMFHFRRADDIRPYIVIRHIGAINSNLLLIFPLHALPFRLGKAQVIGCQGCTGGIFTGFQLLFRKQCNAHGSLMHPVLRRQNQIGYLLNKL